MSCKLRPLQAVARIRRISCSGSGPLDASSTPIEDATHRAGYPRVMRSYPSIANSENIWEHNHRSAFISKCWEAASAAEPLLQMSCSSRTIASNELQTQAPASSGAGHENQLLRIRTLGCFKHTHSRCDSQGWLPKGHRHLPRYHLDNYNGTLRRLERHMPHGLAPWVWMIFLGGQTNFTPQTVAC